MKSTTYRIAFQLAVPLCIVFLGALGTIPPSASEPGKCVATPSAEGDLELTPQQKHELDRLHAIVESIRQENVAQLKPLRAKLKAELIKPQPDNAILGKYMQELSILHETNADRWIDHLLRVKAVLTPTQFHLVLEREWRQTRAIDPCRIDEWEMPALDADE